MIDSEILSDERQRGYCMIAFKVFGGILINPIIFMTALGLSANLMFQQTLPGILGHILKVLGMNMLNAYLIFFNIQFFLTIRKFLQCLCPFLSWP